MKENISYVYIFATKHNGVLSAPCKIGVSTTPIKRLKQAQTFCPYEVEIFACFEMPRHDMALAVEKAFHDVKSENRTHGEWFAIEPKKCRQLMTINLLSFFENMGKDKGTREMGVVVSYERGMEALQ